MPKSINLPVPRELTERHRKERQALNTGFRARLEQGAATLREWIDAQGELSSTHHAETELARQAHENRLGRRVPL